MSNADLMLDGLRLLGLGMGSVFLFLVVLVFAMKSMSALANIFDSGEPPVVPEGAAPLATDRASPTDAVVPVIAAAIAAYRHNHK
ncbi:MAG: OadG family transporter subunit [Gammaproteobacteria bacterium]|jgi:oxaloacetate decarboxylase (Na+ extruding) subunit gamma